MKESREDYTRVMREPSKPPALWQRVKPHIQVRFLAGAPLGNLGLGAPGPWRPSSQSPDADLPLMYSGVQLHRRTGVVVNHGVALEDDPRTAFDWAMH
jgi:hypothetical protein